MTFRPKITVIIPTRERGDVLGSALSSVTSQDYPNLTILVSDNFSSDHTCAVVEANGDPRIRYVNTGRRVSMSHNWEFALNQIADGWVMVLGDDDAYLPGAISRVAGLIADYPGIRAINGSYATYIWPNDLNNQQGRLLVPMRQGIEIRNCRKMASKVLRGEGWYSELPMLYTSGAIEMSLINEIREKTGQFFHSCQPDIYSTIAFSAMTERYVWSHEPIGIAGHSRHSNGASWNATTGKKDSHGTANPNKMFMAEGVIPFHQDITPLDDGNVPLNMDLLVYESYLQAQHLTDNWLALTPLEILVQATARGYPDKELFDQWRHRFAAHHGIDDAAVKLRLASARRRIKRADILYHLRALTQTFRLEPSFGMKIRNSYDASIVADCILKTRPSMHKSFMATLKKRLYSQGS